MLLYNVDWDQHYAICYRIASTLYEVPLYCLGTLFLFLFHCACSHMCVSVCVCVCVCQRLYVGVFVLMSVRVCVSV